MIMKYLHLFLVALALVSCTTTPSTTPAVPNFPRVVKNGCGRYSIQMDLFVTNKDTLFNYIGLKSKQPMRGIVIFGGWDSPKEDTIKILKDKKHNQIWAALGDTIFEARTPYELQFQDSTTPVKVLAYYRQRVDLEKVFTDSIDLCHVYH
jgi:hypothetical protein